MEYIENHRVMIYGPAMINVQSNPIFPEEIESIDKIRKYMLEVLQDSKGVGLAAPQIGLFKKFILVQHDNGYVMDFINPEVTRMYGKEIEGPEGCLSIPPPGLGCLVPRMESIDIMACTSRSPGIPRSFTFHRNTARIIQHELDHLTGTFYIDRVSEKKRRAVLDSFNHWKFSRSAMIRRPQGENGNVDAGVVALSGPQSHLS